VPSASFPWSPVRLVLAEGMEIETSLNFRELSLKESAIPLFLLVFWLACWEMERRPWTMSVRTEPEPRAGGGGPGRAWVRQLSESAISAL